MKKIPLLKFFIVVFFLDFTFSHASFQNKIIANIGDQIITSHELKNKIITNLILNNQEINQNSVNENKKMALQALVNYKLKKNETIKYKIKPNKKAVDNYLERIASRYNVNIDDLKNIFKINNLNFELYVDEIQIEYAWQQLIYNMYNKKLLLDDKQVNEELNQLIKNQQGLVEYELAEIELLVGSSQEDIEQINLIKSELKTNSFENTAIKYSASSSALDGGNLGWINAKALSSDIATQLKNMKKGQVTEPIYKTNSILFIKLLGKKQTSLNLENKEKLKNKIIADKKNELLNLYSNNHLTKIKNNTFINIK